MEQAGVFLIDPNGQLLAMNPAAQRILFTHDGLMLDEGRLTLPGMESPEGALIRVPRRSGKTAWLAWVTPLINGMASPSYRVVTVYDPDRECEIRGQLLQAAFGLTNAELRLAEQIVIGKTPAEAAEALRVTIHTVRTYLKRLYHKVGVRTQATLTRTLLQAAQSLSLPKSDQALAQAHQSEEREAVRAFV